MKFLLKSSSRLDGYGCGMTSEDIAEWHNKTGNSEKHYNAEQRCPCRAFWAAARAMIDNDPVLKLALDSGLITEKEFEWTPDES